MYSRVNLHALPLPFPLQDALRHGRHNTVVSSLNLLECLGESLIVVIQLGGPFYVAIRGHEIPPARGGRCRFSISVDSAIGGGGGAILALANTGILRGLGENFRRSAAIHAARAQQTVSDLLGQGGSGKGDDFLEDPPFSESRYGVTEEAGAAQHKEMEEK